jgi:exopolysaccharide biosynthesis polyprenyl glycosylphosphotransferase
MHDRSSPHGHFDPRPGALTGRVLDIRLPPHAVPDGPEAVVDKPPLDRPEHRRARPRRGRGWVMRRALLVADIFGLAIAYATTALVAGSGGRGGGALSSYGEAVAVGLALPVWVVAAKLYGLYDHDEERVDHSTADDLFGVFNLVTVGAWLVFALARLTQIADPALDRLAFFWAGAVVFVTIARLVARVLCRRHASYEQNAIIVGAGDVGQLIAKKLHQHPEYGINLLGFIDSEPREQRPELAHLTLLGSLEELPQLVRSLDVGRVVIAFSRDRHEDLLPLLRRLSDLDVRIDIVPRFFDVMGTSVDVHSVEGLPVVGLRPLRLGRSSRLLKRTMDLAVSAAALVLLAPLFAAVALLIKLDSPGPIFFRQVRMGTGNRTFRIWKFRTMTADADNRKGEVVHLNRHLADDPRMFKLAADPRVTRIGRLLRRFSLDELPQLLNVLTGEMSLVGPRPLILDEDEYVQDWARKRLDLRPGMTGLWQVLGASEIPFDEMIKLDYRYVAGWSLKTDLELIGRTIPAVFRERNAY